MDSDSHGWLDRRCGDPPMTAKQSPRMPEQKDWIQQSINSFRQLLPPIERGFSRDSSRDTARTGLTDYVESSLDSSWRLDTPTTYVPYVAYREGEQTAVVVATLLRVCSPIDSSVIRAFVGQVRGPGPVYRRGQGPRRLQLRRGDLRFGLRDITTTWLSRASHAAFLDSRQTTRRTRRVR